MSDLRAIAEAATPGPWHTMPFDDDEDIAAVLHGYPESIDEGAVAIVPLYGMPKGKPAEAEATAAHIAAWSPDRALAALDVIEAAGRACTAMTTPGAIRAEGDLRAALACWKALA